MISHMEMSMNSTVIAPPMDSVQKLAYGRLHPYCAPSWMKNLKHVPSVRVQLAMSPTPIHKWNLPGVPQNSQVYIKRDDMTGCALTGNKVRKLEFIFGHIIQDDYKHVITCGGFKSNHCRTTAIIAAQLGINCHLLLRSASSEIKSNQGNLLLSRMSDPSIYLLPVDAEYVRDFNPRLRALSEAIFQKHGEKTYKMPAGGSDSLGVFGYLDAWEEMMQQGVQEMFDDVVAVCGTGGTIAGLAIGNYLTGQKLKIHGITMLFPSKFHYDHINKMLSAIGLDDVRSEDIVDIIEGYVGGGYGISTDEEKKLYKTIAATTGIFCDQVYNGKGVNGLISELSSNQGRFQGNRILYVHTGGIFGLYEGSMSDMFSDEKVHDWKDVEKSPETFLL